MFATNELLRIAFVLISNFTNAVEIPPDRVPVAPQDVQKLIIGSPHSPTDIYITHRLGDRYWIRDGVVTMYESPDSYFNLQDFGHIKEFYGIAVLNSNQVLAKAVQVLRRFSGDNDVNIQPEIKRASVKEVPFYRVFWPTTSNAPDGLASLEIDARNGRVVYLNTTMGLHPKDAVVDGKIRTLVADHFASESQAGALGQVPSKAGFLVRKPETNEVIQLTEKWLAFCHRFHIEPGPLTKISELNWSQCLISKQQWGQFGFGEVCKVTFTNGTSFECFEKKVYGHFGADAAFIGAWASTPIEYWTSFVRPIRYDWKDLANSLQELVIAQTGISRQFMNLFSPHLYTMGTNGVSRCTVRWCRTDDVDRLQSNEAARKAIWAEFDLSSGDIKALRLEDPELLMWEK